MVFPGCGHELLGHGWPNCIVDVQIPRLHDDEPSLAMGEKRDVFVA